MKRVTEDTIIWTQQTVDQLLEAEPYLLEYEAKVAGGIWWQNYRDLIREKAEHLSKKDIADIEGWRCHHCQDAYVKEALLYFKSLFGAVKQ